MKRDPIVTPAIEELSERYTIVIVTHNMQQAARVSDETAFLMVDENRAGYLVEHGDTDIHKPQRRARRSLHYRAVQLDGKM